jgi:acyl-CoA synthetase (AMP-forming)/AMP-acid ligase II
MINKPNYLNMTTSFFIEMAKQYLIEKRFKGRKLDFIFTAFAVGEKLSPGEEKLINKCLRVGRAGSAVSVNGFRFPFTTIGIAAGDCEHGAIYYTLWKQFAELKTKLQGVKCCGTMPEAYVSTTVLKPDGKGSYRECLYGEYGLIVANSYSNMSGYKNNPQATKDLLITDNLGRTWLSCNVYGYIDKLGGVHMKGREELLMSVNSEENIPLFKIEDEILKDTKRILSCQVVEYENQIHAIVQFQHKVNEKAAVESIRQRLSKAFAASLATNIEIIVIPFNKSYPLTHSGKRKLTFDQSLKKVEEKTNTQKLILNNK